jgi:hypothetical protein
VFAVNTFLRADMIGYAYRRFPRDISFQGVAFLYLAADG